MDLIKQIFDSGVVGCGGAGFPTHVKLKASPEILIINGAECEPLLRTDRYLMIHEAEKLVSGVDLICRELSIPEGDVYKRQSVKLFHRLWMRKRTGADRIALLQEIIRTACNQ